MSGIERLTKREPRRTVYPIHLDDDRAQQRADLVGQAQNPAVLLLGGNSPALADIATRVAQIDAQAEAHVHLVAVGIRRCEELMVAYPPTADQLKAAKRLGRTEPRFDPAKVYPVLLSEAIEKVVIDGIDEGRLTVEQVTEIFEADTWPNDQIQDLCSLALNLNNSPTARAVGNV